MRLTQSKTLTWILLCVGLAMGATSAHATEQEELALVIKQLVQVKQSLIRSDLVASTEPTTRYHFNYQSAQEDLNVVIQGIERYLSPERTEPRSLNFPVIDGQYSEENRHE